MRSLSRHNCSMSVFDVPKPIVPSPTISNMTYTQVLLIDSACWSAAAVGCDRLLGALVSAKRNKKTCVLDIFRQLVAAARHRNIPTLQASCARAFGHLICLPLCNRHFSCASFASPHKFLSVRRVVIVCESMCSPLLLHQVISFVAAAPTNNLSNRGCSIVLDNAFLCGFRMTLALHIVVDVVITANCANRAKQFQ